jgi:hypothetical protein
MGDKNRRSTAKSLCASIVAFLAWFALAFQLYLTQGSIANYFSYFTILSNLLVAVGLTFSVFLPTTKTGKFFSSLSVQAAIALYILIVGLVYNVILRGIWTPKGWQLVVDNLLHVLNPILYIMYWLRYAKKEKLNWKDGIYWTIFPFLYLIYSLVRGSVTNWYPYPFLNVAEFGFNRVMVNVCVMTILFFVAGLGLIAVNNKLK